MLFWGFDRPRSLHRASITVTATNPDVIGMDDVRFAARLLPPSPSPPPSPCSPSAASPWPAGDGGRNGPRRRPHATNHDARPRGGDLLPRGFFVEVARPPCR